MITQENRFITIETPLGKDKLLLTGFHGKEELSRPFHFDLSFLSEDHSIAFDKIIGQNVSLSIYTPDGEKRHFHGLISRFSQGRGGGEGEGDSRFSHYSATMVPWLWLLTRTADSRIFQEKSVPDIIKSIFEDQGFQDFSFRLNASYEPRNYCVQYRETDFSFISRLLEEEGIYYFFEHAKKAHTLVIADASGEHPPCPKQEEASCQVAAGGWLEEDVITSIEIEQQIRPGKFTLNDFNFEMPTTNLKVTAMAKAEQNLGPGEREIYDHPGEYDVKAGGQKLVDIRMEEEEAQFAMISGSSVCRAFTSGYRFKLTNHYRSDLNDQEYVLTAIEHDATQGGYVSGDNDASYSNSFQCMPFKVPFRPVRSTPRPVVEGVQTAIVVGPAGEEIHTDEHGRVKVQFHWDREGKKDDKSSCWIRVSQLWAGAKWGAMYVPRIGHEVIVDFIEGDPDRPIIVGRVYHGNNKPPYDLPAEKTKSTLKSDSSPGGGGFNEIRFEDKKGEEQVFIHAEKDQHIRIKNERRQWVGNDNHLIVKKDLLEQVEGENNLTVKGDHNEKVEGTISREAMMDLQEKAGSKHALEAGTEIHLKAGMNIVIEAGVSITLSAGGSFATLGPEGVSISGVMVNINSGGSAGSGSGASLKAPKLPKEADDKG